MTNNIVIFQSRTLIILADTEEFVRVNSPQVTLNQWRYLNMTQLPCLNICHLCVSLNFAPGIHLTLISLLCSINNCLLCWYDISINVIIVCYLW